MMRTPGSCVSMTMRSICASLSLTLRVQFHRALDGGLRMELGGEADLEEHVLHDVAAERLRQRERLALEQDVLKTPGFRGQRGGITHFVLDREQRVAHGAARRVAGRPALARAGVRRMAVGAQGAAVDPGVGQGIDYLLERPAQHLRGDGRRGDAHEQHVIEADAVERIFQREDALDFVRLDHRGQHVAHGQRLLAEQDRASR